MSNPITSPVDFISGPKSKSLLGNLLKGKTASLTAYMPFDLSFKLNFDNFSPAITLEAILARGRPFAFETKGTVLLALGFTSITYISSFLIAYCTFMNPFTLRANASFLVWFSISLIKKGFIDTGGRLQAESPECIPASSICCMIPAT